MAAAASLLMARSTDADTSSTLLTPLGYDLMPEFSTPAVVPKPEKTGATAPACVLLDLNLPVPEIEEEKSGDAAPSIALSTHSPEARVFFRHFASAMAAHPAGIRAGASSLADHGLTDRVGGLSPL
jgi:hypothetical protein